MLTEAEIKEWQDYKERMGLPCFTHLQVARLHQAVLAAFGGQRPLGELVIGTKEPPKVNVAQSLSRHFKKLAQLPPEAFKGNTRGNRRNKH